MDLSISVDNYKIDISNVNQDIDSKNSQIADLNKEAEFPSIFIMREDSAITSQPQDANAQQAQQTQQMQQQMQVMMIMQMLISMVQMLMQLLQTLNGGNSNSNSGIYGSGIYNTGSNANQSGLMNYGANTLNNQSNASGTDFADDKFVSNINDASAGSYGGTELSEEQVNNAKTIARVGSEMGMSQRDITIGIATAMQESTLRNIKYGDAAGPDSKGLFQQRPSQGWGTVEQVTDPEYAASKFFEGLKGVKNRDNMELHDAAQAVQRSGAPEEYEKWKGMAQELTQSLVA